MCSWNQTLWKTMFCRPLRCQKQLLMTLRKFKIDVSCREMSLTTCVTAATDVSSKVDIYRGKVDKMVFFRRGLLCEPVPGHSHSHIDPRGFKAVCLCTAQHIQQESWGLNIMQRFNAKHERRAFWFQQELEEPVCYPTWKNLKRESLAEVLSCFQS